MSRPTYKLKICAGTDNDLKVGVGITVCKDLVSVGYLLGGFEIFRRNISSGVSRTPLTFKETLQGAINRALGSWETVRAEGRAGMGWGIESGVDIVLQETATFVAVARVSKANPDKPQIFTAQSATFPLFKKHIPLLKAGKSLGSILKDESGGKFHPNAGGGGYDSLATAGLVTREDVLYLPLLSAIIRSLRDQRIYHDI